MPVKVAFAQTVPTSADKIIVSNLPADVSEGQIKVGLYNFGFFVRLICHNTRNCSLQPLALQRKSTSVMMHLAAPRVSLQLPFRRRVMPIKRTRNTTID